MYLAFIIWLPQMRESASYLRQKCFDNFKRMVSHLCPEILVFLHMQFSPDGIADDAERDKRNTVYLTGMGNSTRLHIYSKPFGKPLLDRLQFLTLCNKLVSRTDLSQMNLCRCSPTQCLSLIDLRKCLLAKNQMSKSCSLPILFAQHG